MVVLVNVVYKFVLNFIKQYRTIRLFNYTIYE
jgi:hypothetical protein